MVGDIQGGLDDGVRVRAEQQITNLRLGPGETMRTPRIRALFLRGDVTRSINLWRRLYLAHVLPRPDGQPLSPLQSVAAIDEGAEFTAATTQTSSAILTP